MKIELRNFAAVLSERQLIKDHILTLKGIRFA